MNITIAWGWQEVDSAPELISAYDELTEDSWGGTPQFFLDDIAKFDGETRICVITVPSQPIYDLFASPTIPGTVTT